MYYGNKILIEDFRIKIQKILRVRLVGLCNRY